MKPHCNNYVSFSVQIVQFKTNQNITHFVCTEKIHRMQTHNFPFNSHGSVCVCGFFIFIFRCLFFFSHENNNKELVRRHKMLELTLNKWLIFLCFFLSTSHHVLTFNIC